MRHCRRWSPRCLSPSAKNLTRRWRPLHAARIPRSVLQGVCAAPGLVCGPLFRLSTIDCRPIPATTAPTNSCNGWTRPLSKCAAKSAPPWTSPANAEMPKKKTSSPPTSPCWKTPPCWTPPPAPSSTAARAPRLARCDPGAMRGVAGPGQAVAGRAFQRPARPATTGAARAARRSVARRVACRGDCQRPRADAVGPAATERATRRRPLHGRGRRHLHVAILARGKACRAWWHWAPKCSMCPKANAWCSTRPMVAWS